MSGNLSLIFLIVDFENIFFKSCEAKPLSNWNIQVVSLDISSHTAISSSGILSGVILSIPASLQVLFIIPTLSRPKKSILIQFISSMPCLSSCVINFTFLSTETILEIPISEYISSVEHNIPAG